MAKVLDRPIGVASPVDLAKATLLAELPHGRRHGEINSFRPRDLWRAWRERVAARRELRWIDDRLMADAGLDPVEARTEARRPFWRPLALSRDDRLQPRHGDGRARS